MVAHESEAWSAFVRRVKHLPLVLTGENISQQKKLLGIKCGAVDFLEKPVALLKLRNVWQHTVRKVRVLKQAATLVRQFRCTRGIPPLSKILYNYFVFFPVFIISRTINPRSRLHRYLPSWAHQSCESASELHHCPGTISSITSFVPARSGRANAAHALLGRAEYACCQI